jgi:hypothetical protein
MLHAEPDAEHRSEEPELVVDYQGVCPSLTGRSVLTFQIGRHPDDVHRSLHLRIARNSGGGMFCKDWASLAAVDEILRNANPVTARSFWALHPGRSINTAGFVLAILKDLGVVQPKNDNTRHHERVSGPTLLEAVHARMSQPTDDGGKAKRHKGKPE